MKFRLSVLSARRPMLSQKMQILGWAVAISILAGAVDFGEPLDRAFHAGRDYLRSRASDGSLVVVRLDNKALQSGATSPAIRSDEARAIDALFELGARRVFLEAVFADPSPAGDDSILAATLKRHPGRVFLAGQFDVDGVTGRRYPVMPTAALRPFAGVGSILIRKDILGQSTGVPINSDIAGRSYPSLSLLLSGRTESSHALFRPDYSIDYRTIPSVGLTDVLAKAPGASIVSGKDALVGAASSSLGGTQAIPGQGMVPGVYVHAIGAETLRRGVPREIGWVPALLVILGVSIGYLFLPNRRERRLALATGIVVLVGVPFILDGAGVESTTSPAALLLVIVAVRARILARVLTNPVSGLPMLDRIRRGSGFYPGTVVGLKVRNLADLRSNLTASEERALVSEIVRRLRVSDANLEVMQGDDSFVWRSPLAVCEQLCEHIEALHSMLSFPIELGSRSVDLTLAFGLDGETDRDLLNRVGSAQVSADDALAAGERWRVHDPLRLHDADFRLSLLSQLDRAVLNGEIWVAYQPKLDRRNNRICGAEALVRWLHPERGPIGPDKFILAAEAANRITGLTSLVLETAIRDAVSLNDLDPSFSVAVNLSARMLGVVGFVDQVRLLLDKYQLTPSRLTLEVTESAEIDFGGSGVRTLFDLRDLGVKISIDDYGTKFCTLDYIRHLPACEVKIDRAFVGSMHKDDGARIMVRSTIELAHSLGLSVVAEGVELPETLTALGQMKCDVIQGYLIGKPVPFDGLRSFVRNLNYVRAA